MEASKPANMSDPAIPARGASSPQPQPVGSRPRGAGGQPSRSGSGSGTRRRRTSSKRPWWQPKRKLPLPPTERQQRLRAWRTRLLLIIVAFLCGPLVFWTPIGMRALPAVAIVSTLSMIFLRSPKQGLVFSLIYLSFLGGIRRWILPELGPADNDPLLLVGAVLVLLYFVRLVLTRRIHHDTRLSQLLLWLLAIMFLEIFNPLQGGIGVGLGGIIFSIVPVLWYYYGRDMVTEPVLHTVLLTTVGIAIAGAAYGLYQNWFGFLPSEMAWIKSNAATYNALIIGKGIHVFSFFTSSQEYVQLVTMGVVILWAAFLRGMRLALAPIPLLFLSIFLSGSRGPIVTTLIACVILWAVQGKSWPSWAPRLVLAAAVAVFGLVSGLTKIQQNTYDDKTQEVVKHQATGLLAPTDKKTSTAGAHAAMVATGLISGFTTPVGHGLGSTSIASSKFVDARSDDMAGSTEVDITDNFVALGFAGGFIYLAIVIQVLAVAVRNWRASRTFNSLAVLGVLLIVLGQWQHGGLYSISTICWLCIGGLDRAEQLRLKALKAAPINATAAVHGA